MKQFCVLCNDRFIFLFALAIIFVFLMLCGCGGHPYEIVPVSGNVTLNGKPLAGVQINFQPIAADKEQSTSGPGSYAVTDSQGQFVLKTVNDDSPGAVSGKHIVRMVPANGANVPVERSIVSNMRLPRNAMDGSLTYVVPQGGTDEANFDLKLR